MNKLIYTSFSPNTRAKDLALNASLLFGQSAGKDYRELIVKQFLARFSTAKGAWVFNYARSGMFVLFKSLNLPANSEVLVCGFTCSAAINPIKWAGLTPIYVDIDSQTANMSLEDLKLKLTKNSKVVMFQHSFGNSSGITAITNFCKDNNLLLIEDATNTIYGKANDRLIGSFGSVSIFSFGRDKAVSGVDGGLILINDTALVSNFDKLAQNLPSTSSAWARRELMYPLIWSVIKFLGINGFGKLVHFIAYSTGLLANATTKVEKKGGKPESIPAKMPNTLAALAHYQLCDIDALNEHRTELYNIYTKELGSIKNVTVLSFEKGNVPLRFPILVDDKTKLRAYLKRHNIYVGDWYDQPITPLQISLQDYGYKLGICPVSESICARILNLPLHINTSADAAHKIAKIIKKYYADRN